MSPTASTGRHNLSKQQFAEKRKEQANQLYNAKKYKQALDVYSEIINQCPESPDFAIHYSNRCACYMMLSCYTDAMKDAKKCLELSPNLIKALRRLIECSLKTGDILETEIAISKLGQLESPRHSITAQLNNFDSLKSFLSKFEEAYSLKDYSKALNYISYCCNISPFSMRFRIFKAECFAFLSKYSEALQIANDVLYSEKQNVDAMYIRGICLYYQDKVDDAFENFQKVLHLAPDHVKTVNVYKQARLLNLKKAGANAAFKAGKIQDAYNLYTEALLVDPKNSKINAKLHFNKATLAAKLKKMSESIHHCIEALKLDNNYLKAILRKAACHMELEEFEQAVHDYERACKLENSSDHLRLLNEARIALSKEKSMNKDLYVILGINKNSTPADIVRAYRKKAMIHHPDRHVDAYEAEKRRQENMFKAVAEAYNILSDPEKRSSYDNIQKCDFNGQNQGNANFGFHEHNNNSQFANGYYWYYSNENGTWNENCY